jgi:hypothetical protein
MSSTVLVNGRGVVHQTSGGSSTVFPDVCKTPTPGGAVPIPYPNVGRSADTSGGPLTVNVDGSMPMVKGATYSQTSGDEGGSLGGVVSGTVRGPAEFLLYSFDVKSEGRNVCRLGDPLFHNKKNTAG